MTFLQAEAEARERHWQAQVQGLQGKVEKLESLLQREMGHHSPTPRPVYDISPVGAGEYFHRHNVQCTVQSCTVIVCTVIVC